MRVTLFSCCILLLVPTFCFAAKSKSRKTVGVLEIGKPRVNVYKKPSFDSRVLIVLGKGKKLYGTRKTRAGIDGLGLFHKVRLKKGVYGYILDTDIKGFVSKKSLLSDKGRVSKGRKNRRRRSRVARGGKASSKWKGLPLPYYKAFGGSLGFAGYTVEFSGSEESSQEYLVGLKLSGPGWISKALPLDFTFLGHFGGPALFENVTEDASGYFAMADLSFPFQIRKGQNWSLYGGVGLLLVYSDFDLTVAGEAQSSSSLNLGGVGTLGFAYLAGDWVFKFEPKLYFEKTQYFGGIFSIQKVL